MKTQYQKDKGGIIIRYKNTFATIKDWLMITGGVRTLYVGWKIRLLQYTINSTFTVVLLEKLETKFKNMT